MANTADLVQPDALIARLEKASSWVNDTEDAARAAREQRDELIVDALEQGMRITDVARAAGLSHSRVTRIYTGL